MKSINDSGDLNKSLNVERTFNDEQGNTLQQKMEYLIKVLIEKTTSTENRYLP